MPRWGMVIDLFRCVGCYACTVACKLENGTPAGIWYAPVYEKETGRFPNVRRTFLPTLCNHCREAPCARACPTGALYQREDGIIVVNEARCCGSRACMAACPYGAIHFYGEDRDGAGLPAPNGRRYQAGTVQKCTFCSHRIDGGVYQPACVQACPTNCRIFGDLDDPESEVSALIRQRNGEVLRPEAGTQPSVYYLR